MNKALPTLPGRTAIFTIAALLGFAANSLLCRRALGLHLIDAASFTAVRILSGALVLSMLAWRGRTGRARSANGSNVAAAALFTYAAAFSFAYSRVGAGIGALVLFGAVQMTMIGWGIWRGERPGAREWTGLGVALAGLFVLTRPGASAPDPLGVTLMALAGLAWGIYSLKGRGASDPLAATADNFVRSLLPTAVLSALTIGHAHLSVGGAVLAVASGALASGLGYSLWYAALRGLTATRAAIVQLVVPVLAATGGVVFLGEAPSLRVGLSAAALIAGVALAVSARRA